MRIKIEGGRYRPQRLERIAIVIAMVGATVLAYAGPKYWPGWGHLLFGAVMLLVLVSATVDLIRLPEEERLPEVVSRLRIEMYGSALMLALTITNYTYGT